MFRAGSRDCCMLPITIRVAAWNNIAKATRQKEKLEEKESAKDSLQFPLLAAQLSPTRSDQTYIIDTYIPFDSADPASPR